MSLDTILPHRHGGAAGHLLVRPTPQCVNGLDDDHDGQVDGQDPHCQANAAGLEQAAACGLGPEPAALFPLLAALSRLRSRGRSRPSRRALSA